MANAVIIAVKKAVVQFSEIGWADQNDLSIIEKFLNVSSVDVQSLTNTIDIWVDETGFLQNDNYIIGFNTSNKEYKFAGKMLLLGLENDTEKTRGLLDEELSWLDENAKLWAKPIGYTKL